MRLVLTRINLTYIRQILRAWLTRLTWTMMVIVYSRLHLSALYLQLSALCLHSSTRIYTYLHKCLPPFTFRRICRHRHTNKWVQPMALYTYEGEAFLLLRKKNCSPYAGQRCWRDCLNQCVGVCR